MTYHAYFIGGSRDLSKLAVSKMQSVYEFPVAPKLLECCGGAVEVMALEVEVYQLVYAEQALLVYRYVHSSRD